MKLKNEVPSDLVSSGDILCLIEEGYTLLQEAEHIHVTGWFMAQYANEKKELSIIINLLENSLTRGTYTESTIHCISRYYTIYKELKKTMSYGVFTTK